MTPWWRRGKRITDHLRGLPHDEPLRVDTFPTLRDFSAVYAGRAEPFRRHGIHIRSRPRFDEGHAAPARYRRTVRRFHSLEHHPGRADRRAFRPVRPATRRPKVMALLDKFRQLADAREALARLGEDPFRATIERILSPTEAIVNGRPMILAGTNNYLGLTLDTLCIEAAVRAVREEGTGTTGSRMANGSYRGHVALEKDLADFYGRRWCVVFSTGYVANLGLISALTGPGDVILIDADCHASIYDGCRMSGAEVIRFRHNDVGDLDKRLRRFGGRRANALIVVEGIYSTLGDRAALTEVAAVKEEHGACLLVDEAHSLGVLGERGRGLSEESDVESSVDFIVGTFSKSLGATGGFCVSDHHEAELVRYGSRPYIFTASPSPAVVASTRAALNRIRIEREMRVLMWNNERRQCP